MVSLLIPFFYLIQSTSAADSCPTLAAPANGTVSSTTGTTTATVTYACNVGYYVYGSATTTCQIGGAWSSAAPVCLREWGVGE